MAAIWPERKCGRRAASSAWREPLTGGSTDVNAVALDPADARGLI